MLSIGPTDRLPDRTAVGVMSSKSQDLSFRSLERCVMNADAKDTDIDETPEYPLPSPTDSLSRDQRPPDDEEAGVEEVPGEDVDHIDPDATP